MSETLDILHPAVAGYLDGWTTEPDPVQSEMESYATTHDFPIVGPVVGAFLAVLARGAGVKRVFEMGSGFGYSALWFSRAISEGAEITCTELDPENIRRGREWHRRAGIGDSVHWICGDALSAMRDARGRFDLVFCDIDKQQYPEALKIAWLKLRPGGLMVTDNVLWSGRVTSSVDSDPETSAIREFTRSAYALPDADSTIIPLRDGLLVSLKQEK